MNQKELRELIEFLVEKDIAEFEMERGDLKLHIKRGAGAPPASSLQASQMVFHPVAVPPPPMSGPTVAPPSPGVAAQPGSAVTSAIPAAAAASDEAGLHILKSPMVGTYYEAPSPGAPPFIAVGDTVKEGQVLCIIEAMKLMNEIEADATGEIVKMYVGNGTPVEYGMPLFGIRKS
jgi:acetyl-CoA carboxylase biotin carboxyl carrier protein